MRSSTLPVSRSILRRRSNTPTSRRSSSSWSSSAPHFPLETDPLARTTCRCSRASRELLRSPCLGRDSLDVRIETKGLRIEADGTSAETDEHRSKAIVVGRHVHEGCKGAVAGCSPAKAGSFTEAFVFLGAARLRLDENVVGFDTPVVLLDETVVLREAAEMLLDAMELLLDAKQVLVDASAFLLDDDDGLPRDEQGRRATREESRGTDVLVSAAEALRKGVIVVCSDDTAGSERARVAARRRTQSARPRSSSFWTRRSFARTHGHKTTCR